MFASVKGAQGAIARRCMPGAKKVVFQPAPLLKLHSIGEMLALKNPETPVKIRRGIQRRIDGQKGFTVDTPTCTVSFVVCRFKKGLYECWIVPGNGMARMLLG